MKIFANTNVAILSLIVIAFGCGNSSVPDKDQSVESEKLIIITQKQFESEDMKLAGITLQRFEEHVKCNGYIVANVNGMAQVSTPIPGIVESINCSVGNYVRKGQVLCTLSGNEMLTLQQDYIESGVKLKRAKSDYDRVKALYDEKIGAGKDFIAAESEFKTFNAKNKVIKLRLERLGLNLEQIEAGELYATFPVIAPVNGFVTNQDLILGQFVEQQKSIIQIVDVNQLQLQLSVFENDMSKLKTGQMIRFRSTGDSTYKQQAILTSIGKTINQESKTIECLARIKNEPGINLINRSFVEAVIVVRQFEANALPTEAILKSGNDKYVYVTEKPVSGEYNFRKVKVDVGWTSGGYTEIKGSDTLTNVLVKGVYNLPTE